MISITVHHHHHNPHGPLAASCATSGQAKAPAVAPREPSSRPALLKSTSSNVQVQYFRRPQDRQQQPLELLGKLQNYGIEKAHHQVDLNNNYSTNMNHISSLNTTEKNEEVSVEAAEVATTSTSSSVNRKPMKLHSRSISLVISPEFSSDLDSNSANKPLVRRRSLPRLKRRTHLRQMHQQEPAATVTTSMKHEKDVAENMDQQQVANASTGSQRQDANPTNEQQTNQKEIRLRCSMSLPEFASTEQPTMTTMQTTITTITTTTNNSPEAKFRQAGIMLREISDEFARCRRRTI